jgi:hypothetical protein
LHQRIGRYSHAQILGDGGGAEGSRVPQLMTEPPAQIGGGRILAEKWSVSKVKENWKVKEN